MTTIKNINRDQTYFNLFQLADGIYAAIGADNPGAYSNAGIIDLGDQTLVFDSFTTPKAGYELRLAAERVTGRRVDLVINSHAHTHHWMGNQVFSPHTTIITTHTNRLAMPAMADYLLALKEDSSEFEAEIQQHKNRLTNTDDPRWQISLEYLIGRMQASLDSLPDLQPRLPNQTFECRLVFHGAERFVEVFEGQGHSASDVYLYLPEEGVVFLSDLGAFQCQPFLPYGDARIWLEQLVKFENMEADYFIPGHGPVGDKSDLALQADYIRLLLELAIQTYSQEGQAQDIISKPLKEPFNDWLEGGMVHFEANINSLFHHLSESNN
jgi:glyoxylase-like metal-dependent hydrolase (beta-lactamase superfamily II)